MTETKIKIDTIQKPTRQTEYAVYYNLYDYKTKEMVECIDYTPELPIYLIEHPETGEPLYFKFIPEYDYNYGVSKEGIVISFKSHHINTMTNPKFPLKIKIKKQSNSGNRVLYKSTMMSHKGVNHLEYIHSLVLRTWVGLPDGVNPDLTDMLTPPECNHRDLDHLNNDYTNLEWCDRYYNNAHRVPYEEWSFQHTLEFNQKQLIKMRNKMNDLIEENHELSDDDCEVNETKFNKNQQKIDSLQFQINELEFTIYCQLQDKYETPFEEAV